MSIYKFNRDATPTDWRALPRAFKAGEVVHRYSGYDYGCARDDWAFGKVQSIACSLDGSTPFFTVPVAWLTDEHGNQPMAQYG